MEIRLITVKDDFEKAYNLLNQRDYPLSFYEYTLKHDHFKDQTKLKLVGVFSDDECFGTISYKIVPCPQLGHILEVREQHLKNIKGYKLMMDFLDDLAKEEKCNAIKICKNKPERLDHSVFDRMENFLKKLIH